MTVHRLITRRMNDDSGSTAINPYSESVQRNKGRASSLGGRRLFQPLHAPLVSAGH